MKFFLGVPFVDDSDTSGEVTLVLEVVVEVEEVDTEPPVVVLVVGGGTTGSKDRHLVVYVSCITY